MLKPPGYAAFSWAGANSKVIRHVDTSVYLRISLKTEMACRFIFTARNYRYESNCQEKQEKP